MKKIIFTLMLLMLPTLSFAAEVSYSFEKLSENNVGKVKLFFKEANEKEKIQITGYSKKDNKTIEVGYIASETAQDFSELTIYVEGVEFPPVISLKNEGNDTLKFTDLPDNVEYKVAIKTLYDKGIINGYSDNTFKPDALVSRAEFAKMLTLTGQYVVNEEIGSSFEDVSNDYWGRRFIMALANKGILKGKAEKKFAPADTITFGELMTILDRSFNVDKDSNKVVQKINHWSNEAIISMQQSNVIREDDELFKNLDPNKQMTRKDCTLFISRIFDRKYAVK